MTYELELDCKWFIL